MEASGPLSRAPAHEEGLDLHAQKTEPALPLLFVGHHTGVGNLRGDTRTHIPPATATSEMETPHVSEDEDALSSVVGDAGPVASTPIARQHAPKGSREGYPWGPSIPEERPGHRDPQRIYGS